MDSLQNPLVAVPVSYLVTGLLAAGARFIVSKELPTIRRVVETLITSGAVIFTIYPWVQEQDYKHGEVNLIIAIAAFGAKDMLEVMIKLWTQIKKDPLSLLRDFLNRIKPGGDS